MGAAGNDSASLQERRSRGVAKRLGVFLLDKEPLFYLPDRWNQPPEKDGNDQEE